MTRRYGGSLRVLAWAGALVWGLSACGGSPSDQGPEDLAAARPSGGGSGGGKTTGPQVSAVDPDTVPANSGLTIRVLGSGFTTGSQVEWAIKGVPSTKVTTSGPVTFVSSKELQVPVTVAADAPLTSYDVLVTTSSGKKGIGVEMLLVVAEIIPLPEPQGIVSSIAFDVNDAGVIVGNGRDGADRLVALRWTPSGSNWIVERIGDGNAMAINESGYILLSRSDMLHQYAYAVRTPDGSLVQFAADSPRIAISNSGTLAGWGPTGPLAWRKSASGWDSPITLQGAGTINSIGDNDDIVGYASAENGSEWAILWRFNGAGWNPAERVETEFGGTGFTVNAKGSVAGALWPSSAPGGEYCASRPVYWAASGAARQLLASPLQSCNYGGGWVRDMNNADQIAGEARLELTRGAVEWHAVVWLAPSDPAPLDLGALKPMAKSGAMAINDGNLVVGWLSEQTHNRHAAAWRLP